MSLIFRSERLQGKHFEKYTSLRSIPSNSKRRDGVGGFAISGKYVSCSGRDILIKILRCSKNTYQVKISIFESYLSNSLEKVEIRRGNSPNFNQKRMQSRVHIKNVLIFFPFWAILIAIRNTVPEGPVIPHDAQVRRISWVVGSVDRQAYQSGSSCRDCMPVDPRSKRRFLEQGAALFRITSIEDAAWRGKRKGARPRQPAPFGHAEDQ